MEPIENDCKENKFDKKDRCGIFAIGSGFFTDCLAGLENFYSTPEGKAIS